MIGPTPLSPEQLDQTFADLHPRFSRDEAVVEASRCLFCYDPPCQRACPTQIDVPRFIREVLHDNPAGAAETIFDANIFGGSCARACPTEVLCEGACVDRTLLREPVQIGRLQRYATDHAMDAGLRFFEPGPDTGKRVAVVGSGPAGLTCAHELRKLGHAVTVFEARDIPGGLNTLGISAYKITTEFALAELEPIFEMGVEIEYDSPVDAEHLGALRATYDAVFLGIGLGPTYDLDLPGEESPGVWESLQFIFQTHTKPLHECEVGRRVVVIGAGNTAVDVATEAVRLGAESVTMVYRRTDAAMPAFAYEYELAKQDGITFVWETVPVGFETDAAGTLTGVRVQTVRLDGEGRTARLVPVEGSEYTIPCDMAIKALGQIPILDVLARTEGARLDGGRLHIDPATGWTGVPGLFAGGDCTSKGAEIVNAVQEGKLAAAGIDAFLQTN